MNQENKVSKLGREYLSRIHRDLVQDTINFRGIINYNKNLRNDIKEMLVILFHEIDKKEQVQKMSIIYDNALNQVFTPNDNTCKGMIISGALQLIQSFELKEEIVNLYSENMTQKMHYFHRTSNGWIESRLM